MSSSIVLIWWYSLVLLISVSQDLHLDTFLNKWFNVWILCDRYYMYCKIPKVSLLKMSQKCFFGYLYFILLFIFLLTFTFTSLHFAKKTDTLTPIHFPWNLRYSLQNQIYLWKKNESWDQRRGLWWNTDCKQAGLANQWS